MHLLLTFSIPNLTVDEAKISAIKNQLALADGKMTFDALYSAVLNDFLWEIGCGEGKVIPTSYSGTNSFSCPFEAETTYVAFFSVKNFRGETINLNIEKSE